MKTRGSESGFNLIEVVVALALLATVMLTISGLFIQGSQSVSSGRDVTEGTSLATDILEQMNQWSFTQLYSKFGMASTSGAFSVNSLTNTQAQTWQSGITAKLPNAKATIAVTPLGSSTFAAATGIRVQVTIDWTLKLRPRNISLETVRF